MLASFTIIMVCEVAGDLLHDLLNLPVPGSVIGMVLLLVGLIVNGGLPEELDRAASGILSYLPMMFVPAGVGIMVHFDLLRAEWPAIVAALVMSSLIALVVTGVAMRSAERVQLALREAAVPKSVHHSVSN